MRAGCEKEERTNEASRLGWGGGALEVYGVWDGDWYLKYSKGCANDVCAMGVAGSGNWSGG